MQWHARRWALGEFEPPTDRSEGVTDRVNLEFISLNKPVYPLMVTSRGAYTSSMNDYGIE